MEIKVSTSIKVNRQHLHGETEKTKKYTYIQATSKTDYKLKN